MKIKLEDSIMDYINKNKYKCNTKELVKKINKKFNIKLSILDLGELRGYSKPKSNIKESRVTNSLVYELIRKNISVAKLKQRLAVEYKLEKNNVKRSISLERSRIISIKRRLIEEKM